MDLGRLREWAVEVLAWLAVHPHADMPPHGSDFIHKAEREAGEPRVQLAERLPEGAALDRVGAHPACIVVEGSGQVQDHGATPATSTE